jgi:hypothetical protein
MGLCAARGVLVFLRIREPNGNPAPDGSYASIRLETNAPMSAVVHAQARIPFDSVTGRLREWEEALGLRSEGIGVRVALHESRVDQRRRWQRMLHDATVSPKVATTNGITVNGRL